MPFHPRPRPSSVLASVLAAAGLVLTVASCSHLTPLGPDAPATLPPPRHLGTPIILQVMRSQPATAAGGCPAGWVEIPMPTGSPPIASPCYRPVGTPVTITSAGLSPVCPVAGPPEGPPGRTPLVRIHGRRARCQGGGGDSAHHAGL